MGRGKGVCSDVCKPCVCGVLCVGVSVCVWCVQACVCVCVSVWRVCAVFVCGEGGGGVH